MKPEEIVNSLREKLEDSVEKVFVDKGHAVAIVSVDKLLDLIQALKTDAEFDFDLFMDVTAVDWLEREPRFEVVYHLYSVNHNHRLRIKVGIADGNSPPTMSHLYPIADWMEREIWDLYGIKFDGHPNLKRIMMYDEFNGHPLRKDFAYDNRQRLEEETWPVRDKQVRVDDMGIHRT